MSKYIGTLPTLPERGYFKVGDKDAKGSVEVKNLQKFLNWANDGSKEPDLVVDGEIGPKTIAAVKLYQLVRLLVVDGEFGKKSLGRAKKCEISGAYRAVNWAVSVSLDNSFTYGAGRRAHRCGCYFCKTNTGPKKKCKEKRGEPHYVLDSDGKKHTYEKTYCCNTFITAAYAHGANDAAILKICKRGSCCGMDPGDWKKSKHFKTVGPCKKVKFEDLRPGDVIISNGDKGGKHHHVWMYVGGNLFVHASGNNWTKKSIATLSGAKTMYEKGYAKYNGTYVMRYTK